MSTDSAAKLRAAILESDDLEVDVIDVPEWGGVKLELRSPDGDERSALVQMWTSEDDEMDIAKMFPAMIAVCAYDPESGERVFDVADLELLRKKNGAVLQRVGMRCQHLAGMSAEALEDAKGGSSLTLSGATTSDSLSG